MAVIHPLEQEFYDYISQTIDYRIAVIGQVDAGKSALVNELSGSGTYVSTQTDATRDVMSFPYGRKAELLDFPGVGTKEYSPKQYKKLLNKKDIDYAVYIFSSKIREADEEVIRHLSKRKVKLIFVYNKADTLIDVSGETNKALLKHQKNTELHVTFKKHVKDPLEYHFVSIKDKEGIKDLKEAVDSHIVELDKVFDKRKKSDKYFDKFFTHKMNRLATKLLTPGVKDLIVSRQYKAIEQKTEAHFKVDESDGKIVGREYPRALKYVEASKNKERDSGKIKNVVGPLSTMIASVLKIRKLNVVTFIVSTFGEASVKTVYPVLKGIFDYVREMNDFAREVLKVSVGK